MSASDYPKDENLRLVLSVGHEEWLQAKRVEARKYLIVSVCVAVLGTVWLVGVLAYSISFIEKSVECAVVPEGRTLEGMVREGLLPPGIERCEVEEPISKAVYEDEPKLSTTTKVILWLVSLFAVIIVPTSLIEVSRSIARLDELKTYTQDHKAFLEKYDRG